METKTEDQVLKIRSARSVVAAGLRLYTGNFRRIFRSTWLLALVYSVAGGIYGSYSMSLITAVITATANGGIPALQSLPTTSSALLAVGSLLSIVLSLLLYSSIFSILATHREEGSIPNRHDWLHIDRHMLVRTLASWALWFVVSIVAGLLIGGLIGAAVAMRSLTLAVAAVVAAVVVVALMLPLVYAQMHYLTTRSTPLFRSIGTDYLQGLHHWGHIFAVLFVTALIITAIVIIVTLPADILLIANTFAQTGAAQGDPLGMPGYMPWMLTLVLTLAYFILTYATLAIHFPAYYMTGSIETKENEKKNSLY